MQSLVEVPNIFYFFLLGGGEGGVWVDREGGGRFFFLLKIPGRGGGSPGQGGGQGGREGVCRIFGGGGLNIFFRGRNAHQESHAPENA